jgi:hypothetical protein
MVFVLQMRKLRQEGVNELARANSKILTTGTRRQVSILHAGSCPTFIVDFVYLKFFGVKWSGERGPKWKVFFFFYFFCFVHLEIFTSLMVT